MPEGTFRAPLNLESAMAALRPAGGSSGPASVRFEHDPGKARDEPFTGGDGPLVCSTSTELVAHPALVWDVAHYYRDLGLDWPYDPTLRELREAAIEARVWEDPRLMHGLKVISGKFGDAERRLYRSMFLGERYYDPFVQDEIKAQAQSVVSDLAAEGVRTTREKVMEEMGFKAVEGSEDAEATRLSTLSALSGSPFPWSFWLWPPVYRVDLDVLAEWQTELIRMIGFFRKSAGNLEGFAVGLASDQEWEWNVRVIDGTTVFFINVDGPPGPTELYERAFRAVRQLASNTTDER